jgi:Glyoxalase-like domain
MNMPAPRLDHLVYATPDLDTTVNDLAHRLGVRASAGGQHPGRGTRNALLALGPSAYFEIVGPDPSQPPLPTPRWFGIDRLSEPTLVGWAVATTNLERVASAAAAQGVSLGRVISGGRTRPDGLRLTWHVTDPTTIVGDGIVPFLIDWGSSPHPAETATGGVELVQFRAEHPEAAELSRMLHVLGVRLSLHSGPAAKLIATLRCGKAEIEVA